MHTAPTINTPKLKAGPSGEGDFEPLWANGMVIPWGHNIYATAQVTVGDKTWYRVDSFGDGINYTVLLSTINITSAWVAVEVGGLSYVESSSCSPTSYTGDITFYYDRLAAAVYATSQSRLHYSGNVPLQPPPNSKEDCDNNRAQSGTVRVTSDGRSVVGIAARIADGPTIFEIEYSELPYGVFSYAGITGCPGSTGSAFFTSEGIWFGGPTNSVFAMEPTPIQCNGSVNINGGADGVGWRYCAASESSSGSWRDHHNVIPVFSGTGVDIEIIQQTRARLVQEAASRGDTERATELNDPNVYPNVRLSQFQREPSITRWFHSFKTNPNYSSDPRLINSWNVMTEPIRGFPRVTGSSGEVNHPQDLWEYLEARHVTGSIQAGDYVWINFTGLNWEREVSSHGLLVAGWGPAINCEDAINAALQTTPQELHISDPTTTSGPYYVPYVVDFSGWAPNNTIRSVAQPFYCTKYAEIAQANVLGTNDNTFLIHHWVFIPMPDLVIVSPDEIYPTFP